MTDLISSEDLDDLEKALRSFEDDTKGECISYGFEISPIDLQSLIDEVRKARGL